MNLGWILLYLFLSIKKDDIQCVFFHKIKDGIFITLQNEFQVYFSSVYEAWISDKEQMKLWYVFHLFMGVWISDKEWMNFMVCFSSVFGGMYFWQGMDEFYGMLFISLWGVNFWQRIDEFPLKDGWFILFGISVPLNYFYHLWPTCLNLKYVV